MANLDGSEGSGENLQSRAGHRPTAGNLYPLKLRNSGVYLVQGGALPRMMELQVWEYGTEWEA